IRRYWPGRRPGRACRGSSRRGCNTVGLRSALRRAMRIRRVRRIGRREAERLLSGAQPSADRDALVRVLRLAAAPPHPTEVTGQKARVDELVRAYWVAAQETPVAP